MTTFDRKTQISDRSLFGFTVLFAIFVAACTIAGFHGAKLVQIGSLVFDAGLVTFSLSFLATDIVSEVYGKQYSKKMILGGFVAIATTLLFTKLALVLPGALDWTLSGEYDAIFGAGSRVSLALIATYITSQVADITVFTWLRKKTKGKYLWLRNNLSTMVGGLVDAIVFTTVAFAGVYEIVPIILSAYAVRLIISVIDTPFVYFGVTYLRSRYPELKG